MADYAIVVGIDEYPNVTFRQLYGPRRDVDVFKRWLMDPAGGNVPEANITTLITVPPTPATRDCKPNHDKFFEALENLCYPNGTLVRRPNDRLYLYFSGHGFTDYRNTAYHAALFAANTRAHAPESINGTSYLEWVTKTAAFGEVVLIMDCCRNEEVTKSDYPHRFGEKDYDSTLAAKVKTLEMYASPAGLSAQERAFGDVRQWHGIFTYALVTALYCSPLEAPNGIRTAHSVKTFIEGIWQDLVGTSGLDKPAILLPKTGDIGFGTTAPRLLPRTIQFNPPPAAAATLALEQGPIPPVQIEIDAYLASARLASAGSGVPFSVSDSALVVQLPIGIYKATLRSANVAERSTTLTMAGDVDAVL